MDHLRQPEPKLSRQLLGLAQLPFFALFGGGSLIVTNCIQVIIAITVLPWNVRLHRKLNCMLAASWWTVWILWQRHILRCKVVITGDAIPKHKSAILIANHQNMTDIPALFELAMRAECLGGVKFFVKSVLKWVPGVGWGIRMLDFLFVKRSWAEDADFVNRMFARLREYTIPVWIFSFPEGTRITQVKLAKSRKFAGERGYPNLQHVLLPRPRGFIATLVHMRQKIDGVYDCTIGFPQGVPTFLQYLRGAVAEIHLHVKRYPADTLPLEEAALEAWLLERFSEKDKRLDSFFRKRHF